MSTGNSIGALPGGWRQSELGKVAKWGSGGTPKANNSAYYGGSIPWAIIGDLNDGIVTKTANSITQLGLDESSSKLVPKGTLLIAMYGSIGKLGIAGVDLATNQAIAFATPFIDEVTHKFLFHYLASQKEVFLASGKGMTQQNISQTVLKAWPIPLPPIAEQEKIVEILEEQLSHIDFALVSLREIRAKAVRFRRSLLHSSLNGSFIDSLEKVEKSQLSDCSEMSLGIMLDKAKGSGAHLTPYMGNINVRWGEFNKADLKLMDIKPEQMERSLVRNGDVVVCEGGEPGRTAVWKNEEPVAIQKALHRVRPSADMDSNFIGYCLELEFRGVSEHRLFTGTTIKHLPKEKLKTLRIPKPSLDTQRRIVEFIEQQLARTDTSMVLADAIEKKSTALRRSLFYAAFSGELTQEWREGVNV